MSQLNKIYLKLGGLIICVAMLLVVNLSAAALSDTYQFSEGDMVALRFNFYAQSKWKTIIDMYDIPFVAFYSSPPGKITVNIYGTKERVEDAQAAIQQMLNLLEDDFIPYMKNSEEIELKTTDVRFSYRNRNEEGVKEIILWENGQFKFPVD